MSKDTSFRLVVIIVAAVAIFGGAFALLAGAGIVAAEPATEDSVDNDTRDASIEFVRPSGDGYINEQSEVLIDHPGIPFVWQNESLEVEVGLRVPLDIDYELCVRSYDEAGDRIGVGNCTAVTADQYRFVTATVKLSPWPADFDGNNSLFIELQGSDLADDPVVTETVIDVYVIAKEGDLSGNGLTNYEEIQHGTDFTRADTIGNGLTDWEEIHLYGTNPLRSDTTGDGVSDARLVQLRLDPTEPYILHRYVAGLIVLQLLVILGIVVARRRLSDEPLVLGNEGHLARHIPGEPFSNDGGGTETMKPVEFDDSDRNPLTNEEHVLQLLADNDGRMKQKIIVESTDWSKAKVSRVLSNLQDKGYIEKIRIGRENVVDLLGEHVGDEAPASPEIED